MNKSLAFVVTSASVVIMMHALFALPQILKEKGREMLQPHFGDLQKENMGALRSVENDLGKDIKDLSRDTVKLNSFRDTSKETLADLNKRSK